MELFIEVLLETAIDTAKMLPFLYLAYLLVEYIERRHGEGIEKALARGGRFGFMPGALLGCIPQCGFSAVAANLYSSRVITLGTLLAVFLATSDEAVPLLAAVPEKWGMLLLLLLIKLIYGICAGYIIDFALVKLMPASLKGGYSGSSAEVDCHKCHEEDRQSSIWLAALKHTGEILLFIFLFGLAVGLVVEAVGLESFASAVGGMGFMQPLAAALIGLIPNCAASVLLTRLYLDGVLRFSGLIAGLCSGAGVGLAVLWRSNKSAKQSAFITVLLWALGALAGVLTELCVRIFA